MLNVELTMIRQEVSAEKIDNVGLYLEQELKEVRLDLRPGASVAIAVGSRGIANLRDIVGTTVKWVTSQGWKPFIVPAMGSHGGATPEGQQAVLEHYGITEANVGAPILSSLEVVELPGEGLAHKVYMDKYAYEADGVIVINRIKPHTDFHGTFESGLMKMCAIGLGKHRQALEIHRFGVRGLKDLIVPTARQIIKHGRVVLGIGIVENAKEETAIIKVLQPDEFEKEEPKLLAEAKRLMPKLPIDQIDVLIIDEFGKDISGVGLDPNITGRIGIRGEPEPEKPQISSILLADLTEGSHGNALGMGLADVITKRVYEKIDFKATYENGVTSGFLERAKMPMVAETDGEGISYALRAAWRSPEDARIARIKNTLSLEELYVSSAVLQALKLQPGIEITDRRVPLVQENGFLPPFD
ncbi:MAG: DUF362 domain-containing protein [Firmicutes bacterium]|nr:DUF362 domain-containing protein [Bacillota bacterium]